MLQANTIQATRAQVENLLREQSERLQKMLAMELLRERGGDGAARSLDRPEAQRLLGIIDNELRKVARMEMVLAVVGTMKAGKSTVINAIVGAEILPNRNQPMTALPTLIRHTPGRVVPVLRFPRRGPMLQLADTLRGRLRRLAHDDGLERLELFSEPDGRQLILRLIDGEPEDLLPEACTGQQEIFPFLRDLNDLARLARDPEIRLELPLDEYQGIDELPVIEVAFAHLGDAGAADQGTLSLLDTPGHNECGQSRQLLRIVREQLARASAVLAVLDYTQLKSEAEEEVRLELARAMDEGGSGVFVLVNKFDQKDRHGMTADELRLHVAQGLMDGRVDPQRVFPVAARFAYLANLAAATMDADGRLPDPREAPWVEDFAHLALGSFWEEQVGNGEKVRAAGRKLWQRSQFDAPLRQVVRRAAARAAVLTMKSALAKLAEHGRTIDNFMQLRRGAILGDTARLGALMQGLDQDLAAVDSLRGEADGVVRDVTHAFEDFVEKLLGGTLAQIDSALERSVAELAPPLPADTEADAPPPPATMPAGRPGKAVFGKRVTPAGPREGTPARTLRHADRDSGEAAARTIAQRLQAIMDRTLRQAEDQFVRACADMQARLGGRVRRRVGDVLERTASRMADQGLSLDLDFPAPRLDAAAADFGLTIGALLARRTEKRVGKRERDGLSAEMGRLLWGGESDAGFETFRYNDVYYEIDPARVRHHLATELDALGFEMRRQARDYAQDEVEPRLQAYFSDLRRYLQGFRGDLADGIDDRRLDADAVERLARQLDQLAEAGQESAGGIAQMRQDLDESVFDQLEDIIAEAATAPQLAFSLADGPESLFDGASGRLTIGRSPDSRLPVNCSVASRNHCTIEYKDGAFVLTDHSTNGTVLVPSGGAARVVKNESVELPASGRIGVGARPDAEPAAAIAFRVE